MVYWGEFLLFWAFGLCFIFIIFIHSFATSATLIISSTLLTLNIVFILQTIKRTNNFLYAMGTYVGINFGCTATAMP